MAPRFYQTGRQIPHPAFAGVDQCPKQPSFMPAPASDTLPMLLLMQQMFRRRGTQLPITIGQRIAWDSWHSTSLAPRDLADKCRKHVRRLAKAPGVFKTECAIARPEDRATLRRELSRAECLGRTADGKIIYLWQRQGQEDAPLLRELGRLREIAFRAVGEGSGKRRDTDRYDDDYLHLILWDETDLEIVGAYRFTPTARQVEAHGRKGCTAIACSITTNGCQRC
jgi:hypothetical protein